MRRTGEKKKQSHLMASLTIKKDMMNRQVVVNKRKDERQFQINLFRFTIDIRARAI